MFVDTNRGMAVLTGEKDNKKAIDKRKKNLIKEKLKYGKDVVEEVELSWDHYYAKVKSPNKAEKDNLNVCFSRPPITKNTIK